ncbi:amidase [Pseudooceanicola nanhaiensis]|uniref:amidase n=1 Tax=Pseudooceanicola nanhaiensis TaxID=375761 RepID=UPI001CD596FE|nr:amidase [Pseudooceanicola nanhaiensis]MCA0920831.1 amidase [Pseudooceanicola nanhaiensis]
MKIDTQPTELWQLSAVDLAAGIAGKQFTSREATESAFTRLDAVNGQLNAVVEVMRDEALAAADAADAAVTRGETLGLLHGVPCTIKMNVDWQDKPRNNGIIEMQGTVATKGSSPVTDNMLRAGAILLGQTNCPAFASRAHTSNELYGQTLNPWDPRVTAGGSSGGAAAAVAAGIGAIAHGNDLGGSVRQPAYVCGVVGLKCTPCMIPNYNPSVALDRPYLHQSTTSQGPLARSVADAELGFRAMSARDPRDPWWVPPLPRELEQPFPCRVALFFGDGELEPEVRAAMNAAAAMLEDAGCTVEEAEPPRYAESWELHKALLQAERMNATLKNIERYGDQALRNKMKVFENWRHMTPIETRDEYIAAIAMRSSILREWTAFLDRYPLLITPNIDTQSQPAEMDQLGLDAVDRDITSRKAHQVISLLSLPALTVPTGVTNGLPDGVQLVGQRMQDLFLFRAAAAIEARAGTFTPIDPRGAR